MTSAEDVIASSLEASRKELLDLGFRNPLLNYRTLKTRGLEIVDELPPEVFRVLVVEGESVSFLPGKDDDESDLYGQPEEYGAEETVQRHTDARLQTAYSSKELQFRLLSTYYQSNAFMQDHGANILFIALGMLNWYESESSETVRRSPVVLIPVELERANARDRFRLQYTGEDIGGNLSLIEKLKMDFGIALPVLPDVEEFDIMQHFDAVEQAAQVQPRWSLDRTSVILGFFSFSKFLMYRDLDVRNWPERAKPSEHRVIRALLHDGFNEDPPLIDDLEHLDEHLPPENVHHVVDADSSQILTINDAINGRNLVVQGPPGTGKSQTIANMIAEAIGQGKTVLFVSEKMAALEVVKRRLDSIGIGDACLELHSHKTTKKAVLDELKRTLELGRPRTGEIEDDFATLTRLRERLNEYCNAVNLPVGETGISPFQAFGEHYQIRQSAGGTSLPKFEMPTMHSWTRGDFRRKQEMVNNLEARLSAMGVPREHPFWGCQLKVLLPSEQDRLTHKLKDAQDTLKALMEASAQLADALNISVPIDPPEVRGMILGAKLIVASPELGGIDVHSGLWQQRDRLDALISSGSRLSSIHAQHDPILVPGVWEQDLLEVRQALVTKGRKFWRILSGEYHRAKNRLAGLCRSGLPSGLDAQIELVDAVLEAQSLRKVVQEHTPLGETLFSSQWRGEQSDWNAMSLAAEWVIALHQHISDGSVTREIMDALSVGVEREIIQGHIGTLENSIEAHNGAAGAAEELLALDTSKLFEDNSHLADQPLFIQENIIDRWLERLEDIHQILGYNNAAETCRSEGLEPVLEAAESWLHGGSLLVDAFSQSWYESILEQALHERKALAVFDTASHEQQVERFRELDRVAIEHNRARLALMHWQDLPRHEAGGQLGILAKEFAKRRRHLPIQQLMTGAGNAIQAIKPVFMMSPLSIASYIPAGGLSFDMVIFDEASQIKPVDAFGAIMRAEQAVVVGDSQQLPPTNFFDTMIQSDDEDDDSATRDIQSILGLFSAKDAPSRMLRWHYRSRHESLIAVSNKEFYQNRLVIFPSPDAAREEVGLKFHYLPDATYDRGRTATNRKEAEAVAHAVMEHARIHYDLTLGVAAFSTAQMRAILDQLELLRRQDPSVEGFFAAHPHEPFFVKNLENVQGDERDVIFISVGYGRDSDGRVSMNFGPLVNDGGERRLNVLISRARLRCEVFTNLTADDIDLSRTKSRGVAALKTYLAYAQNGTLEMPVETDREVHSPFQNAVASELSVLGYHVRQEVGVAGFFIDIAVADPERPGRYLIGIECDGATYHSARSARDRDRLREEVLESRGWKLHRIWSTDWFRNPERELKKAVEAIEQARTYQSSQRSESDIAPTIVRDGNGANETLAQGPDIPKYKLAELSIHVPNRDLSLVSRSSLVEWITEVVNVESPAHISEVERRVADAAGIMRVGPNIKKILKAGIGYAAKAGKIRTSGEFLWRIDMEIPVIRDRSELPPGSRKLELIPPEEIEQSIIQVVTDSYGINRSELPPITLRLFGIMRTTEDLRRRLDSVISDMVAEGRLSESDGHLSI